MLQELVDIIDGCVDSDLWEKPKRVKHLKQWSGKCMTKWCRLKRKLERSSGGASGSMQAVNALSRVPRQSNVARSSKQGPMQD